MAKRTIRKPTAAKVSTFAKAKPAKSKSGQVPEGRVRFSVNLPEELHRKLVRAAAQRQIDTGKHTSMGDLVAELVRKHL